MTSERVQVSHERALHELIRVECSISTGVLLVEHLLPRETFREVPVSVERLLSFCAEDPALFLFPSLTTKEIPWHNPNAKN
jgi:hypothetical protein